MPLTKEQLLQNRFKFIMPYPGSHWEIGDILRLKRDSLYFGDSFPDYWVQESILERYPHIFQPLPWYSDREINELPEYVKWNIGEPKVQTVGFDFESDTIWLDGYQHTLSMWIIALEPATETEYLAYINPKQQ